MFAGHDIAADAKPGSLYKALLILTACLGWVWFTGGDGSLAPCPLVWVASELSASPPVRPVPGDVV